MERYADLVFEGGGVKGIGLAGAFAALRRAGFSHKRVAGTSAGAITAALVAAGYDADELDAILLEVPFERFKDRAWEDRVPLLGTAISVLMELGIYEGRYFEGWLSGLLVAKGVTRFGHLADPQAAKLKDRYRLKVIASDVTHRRMLVLPDDAEFLGVDPDELEIAYAVRMSMSIPVFFEPVVHPNPVTGEDHLIVDGGMLSNFPVWLFDAEGRDPRWPTFGLLLVEDELKVPIGQRLAGEDHAVARGTPIDYVKAMAMTMMAAHDRLYVEQSTFARTIPIPTLGVGTTEFGISPARIQALYASGARAAGEFLERWDFEAYIRDYRSGREPSRREKL